MANTNLIIICYSHSHSRENGRYTYTERTNKTQLEGRVEDNACGWRSANLDGDCRQPKRILVCEIIVCASQNRTPTVEPAMMMLK